MQPLVELEEPEEQETEGLEALVLQPEVAAAAVVLEQHQMAVQVELEELLQVELLEEVVPVLAVLQKQIIALQEMLVEFMAVVEVVEQTLIMEELELEDI
jgi:hypothetical protein